MKNRNIPTFLIIILIIIFGITTYSISNFSSHRIGLPKALDKEHVENIVKDYILKNPELIIQAMKNLEVKSTNNYLEGLQNNIKENRNIIETAEKTPIYGNQNADVTIVQFYDYRCGYCKKFANTLSKLLETDTNIKVVFREYPILGEKSQTMARFALAVNEEFPNKFWEFHNKLMESKDVSQQAMKEILQELNINYDIIYKKSESKAIKAILEENKKIGKSAHIAGTPTVIINGNLIMNPYELSDLQAEIKKIRAH